MTPRGFKSAEDLKRARTAVGWTQGELAANSGFSVDAVKYWEAKKVDTVCGVAPSAFFDALALGKADLKVKAKERAEHNISQQAKSAAPCGAKTPGGAPCQAVPVLGSCRCKQHGGNSTGPKTAAGRDRIRAAQIDRWRRWRRGQPLATQKKWIIAARLKADAVGGG